MVNFVSDARNVNAIKKLFRLQLPADSFVSYAEKHSVFRERSKYEKEEKKDRKM